MIDERALREKMLKNIDLVLEAHFGPEMEKDRRLRGGGALLERATGIPAEKLTSIRRGRSFFSVSEILTICQTFDVTLDFIFRDRRAGLTEEFLQFLAERDRAQGRRSTD